MELTEVEIDEEKKQRMDASNTAKQRTTPTTPYTMILCPEYRSDNNDWVIISCWRPSAPHVMMDVDAFDPPTMVAVSISSSEGIKNINEIPTILDSSCIARPAVLFRICSNVCLRHDAAVRGLFVAPSSSSPPATDQPLHMFMDTIVTATTHAT